VKKNKTDSGFEAAKIHELSNEFSLILFFRKNYFSLNKGGKFFKKHGKFTANLQNSGINF
jgi:hypothetical protein